MGTFDISTELFLSLLSFHPKLSLSSSHFLSVISALSSFFALLVVGSLVVGLAGVGLVLRRTWSEPPPEIFFINQQRIFFFFSQICTATTCEASHHHRPQETHPTATPRRRYPPRWPRREGENHPAGHAPKERPTPRPSLAVPDPNGLEVTHPCRSAWTSGLAPNELELAKKGITGSGARPGGGGAVLFGGWEQDFGCWN